MRYVLMGKAGVSLRQRAGIRGSVLLLCFVGAGGCATRPAPAAPQPVAAPLPPPLVFGPTPDEQLRQLQTRVDVRTDRVNDIYLRQVQMEQRLEEMAEAVETLLPDAAEVAE
jgi:hypothetical protein